MKEKIRNIGTEFILRTEDDGDGIIAINGNILRVNPITLEIIKRLESNQSIDEISLILSSSYNVTPEEVHQDIMDFLYELNSYVNITRPDLVDLLYG
ncbi:hypothetical protein DMN77_00750 [Paenibacillus sp. 79R4]|uniref:PqqD family protein n=1 Tax=Paenibacillus sp. 79R4 TaxID=2212847 RepID=UPI0015BFA9DE|nr:PqqD family protein [Paenibacillus sp. 79R4]NWL86124.1 hypothetical protein [Paenibacillus sp. 79R4]